MSVQVVTLDWNVQEFSPDCPIGWQKDAQAVIQIPNDARPGAAHLSIPTADGWADFVCSINLTKDQNDWSPHKAMTDSMFHLWVETSSPATTPPAGSVVVTPGELWYCNVSVQNVAKHPGPTMKEVAVKFELAGS